MLCVLSMNVLFWTFDDIEYVCLIIISGIEYFLCSVFQKNVLLQMNYFGSSLIYSNWYNYWIKKIMYVMSILQDYDAFFLFSFTFGANHDNPSTNPSPFTAQQAWMYQSWLRILRKSSFSVISEGEAAFGKSCLFAKMSNMEFLKRSSWIKSWSSSFTSTNLSLSQESTTQIRASLFSK